ncbi:hypothetical protein [Streptococcus sp. oral taxon 061]|uniref:hypothetical protein n=1 Tax=Streptococcus sp. oral taxon 061 TaxID=712623 RepID=UPI0015BCD562|nr:hypothetical protein [Streptococcus sp. oral taxon 061]QLF54955.1 hypothetical protein HW271_01150 [Streptococcus sp. oral taxon 061]
MFFLRRRRVFIGECDGQAVYYDQKTGEALAAPKSRLLNTEKAGDTNAFIPDLVILLLAGGPAISGFFSLKFVGVYNWFSLACILLFWLMQFFSLVALLERALYKNVRKAQPTTEKVFYYAASHNLLVKNQFDPRQLGTLAFRFVRFAVNIVSIYYFLYFLTLPLKFGQPINEGYGLWFAGLLFFVIFLMYNQNNPVRFVKIMRLYSQGKVRFKEEVAN